MFDIQEGEEDVTVVMTAMKVHMIVVLMLNQNGVKREEEGEGDEGSYCSFCLNNISIYCY